MSGRVSRKEFAYDDFAPSHNLRALIQSSQQRRSVDCGDRRRIEKQKNKKNQFNSSDPRRGSDGSQPSKLLSINDDFVPPSSLKKKAPPNANRKQEMTAEAAKEIDAKKPIEGGIEEETEEQQPDEPLFHIWGVNDFLTDDKRTDGQTQPNSDRKQTNASVATESSDLCGTSFEIISPPSPKTPTEEQPFANPMDRLRKRTELEIKESGSASVTAPPLTSLGFYGFPHRRSVSADGKKIGENKYCRAFAEPRLHASEPLWVPTFQNRPDIMSQFAPYDERLNNNSPDDWSVWEVLRTGYPGSCSWLSSAIENRHKEKKRKGELERWKHFIAAH